MQTYLTNLAKFSRTCLQRPLKTWSLNAGGILIQVKFIWNVLHRFLKRIILLL